MQICSYDECTGCGACANICPCKCIEMKEDIYGELHPNIIKIKCVGCNKCVKNCPANNQLILSEPIVVYASWRTNLEKLKDSASGGIGAVLAENWIEQGGIVFGTEFDENFHAKMKMENTLSGAERFKGSKYVQCYTGNSYIKVKKLLKANEKILFFGTPCQLAGLYAVVGHDNPNLCTVEILCHGVSPDKYLQEQLSDIRCNLGEKKFNKLTFRTNRWLMDYFFTLWDDDKVVFCQQGEENEYFRGFLTGLTLRESCYQCLYKRTERVGDILIGDFIGFGKYVEYDENHEKPSLILVMNHKGLNLINSVINDVVIVERSIDEALIDGTSLKYPFPMHEKHEEFRKLYKEKGFIESVQQTVGKDILSCKRKNWKTHLKRNIKLMMKKYFKIKIQGGRLYHGY